VACIFIKLHWNSSQDNNGSTTATKSENPRNDSHESWEGAVAQMLLLHILSVEVLAFYIDFL